MSTAFPGGIDNFINPAPTTDLDGGGTPALVHSKQHSDSNDAIEAIETTVGVTGSADPASLTFKVTDALAIAVGAGSAAATAQGTANTALAAAGLWTRDAPNTRTYLSNTSDDLISGATSTEWTAGTDLKIFFDKSKAALRGGSINSNVNNDASRGNFSLAWGSNSHTATGADAVALGNNAKATGNQSLAAAGSGATASGDYSVCFSGGTASGNSSFVGNGNGGTASAIYATAFGGGGTASGRSSFLHGIAGNTASRYYQYAHGGSFGECQYNRFLSALTTTNATPALMTFDQAAVTLTGSTTNVLTVPINKGHKFIVNAIARSTTANAFASWEIKGSIVRYSSGNAKFISAPVVTADKEAAAAAWDLAVTIVTTDATNNYLALTATGAAATTIKWAATIETVEQPN